MNYLYKKQYSQPEISSQLAFISNGVRIDCRNNSEFRRCQIEVGVNPLSNGSSRVRLGSEMTDVLCSVKAEISQKPRIAPLSSPILLEVKVMCDCGIPTDERDLLYSSRELTEILRKLLNLDNPLFRTHLNIISGVCNWNLLIDVQVLCYAGNVIDACSLAISSALESTTLPQLVTYGSEINISEVKSSNFERDLFELALDDKDELQTQFLPFKHILPISITFAHMSSSICVVDPSLDEEGSMIGFSTFSFDVDGNLVGSHIRLGHGFDSETSINCVSVLKIINLIQIARQISVNLHQGVLDALEKAQLYDNEKRRTDSRQMECRVGFH